MGGDRRGPSLRQVTFIAVRLVAVYVVAQAMFYFPQAAQIAFSGGSLDASNWAFVLGFLLFIAAALLLWTQADRLAQAIARGTDTEISSPITSYSIELTAFGLLGLFILVGAIPRLASDVAQLIAPNTFDQFLPPHGPSDNYRVAKLLETVGTIGRVAIGIWLLLGTRSFVGWLRRLRERARSGPPSAYVDADIEEHD